MLPYFFLIVFGVQFNGEGIVFLREREKACVFLTVELR